MNNESVITKYRKKKHWSVTTLAEKLKVSRQTLWTWETKKVKPSIERCEQIAKALSIGATKVINDYRN